MKVRANVWPKMKTWRQIRASETCLLERKPPLLVNWKSENV